jgi:predicted DNA-binding transcriptional regulator YafY
MPVNKLALIRYKTIDNCLRNHYRKWTLDDLIETCSNALSEFEGKTDNVSKRTVQLDIQLMRSEKLGYNAPIVVIDKKYYTYSDPKYSITNLPLNNNDFEVLSEITVLLKQFSGFSHFTELDDIVKRLENKVLSVKNPSTSIIDFEKNENLKGLKYLDTIYLAIIKKQQLKVVYQSFTQTKPIVIYLSPYLLKEYRNRWFAFGKRSNSETISPMPLDRILRIKIIEENAFVENTFFEPSKYFKDIIGVTRFDKPPERVVFWVSKENAPYVFTKPFHSSQQFIEHTEDGTIFSIQVIPNFELERELLGFGEHLKVISPEHLKNKIACRISAMVHFYEF